MKKTALLLLLAGAFLCTQANPTITTREYYQLTIYHFSSADQEKRIDAYLQQAWIPAVHRKGISKVGVFKPVANDTAAKKQIYVLVALGKLEQVRELADLILTDHIYQQAAKEYLESPHNNPPYQRMENIISYAFELAPRLQAPQLQSPRKDRIYEFRSYEGGTEALYRSKVKMFNAGGEIVLFKKLQFNAIFYAEVISGSRMPNLIYMTSFENMQEREQHWKDFFNSPEWKKLLTIDEYKNTVSKAEIVLMRGVDYSDY